MIKVKDGYAKLIGTTYLGSASRVLLSNGGDIEKAVASTANTLVLRNSSGLIESTLATGIAPFKITSTTLVNNLNSNYLEGLKRRYRIQLDNVTNTGPYCKLMTIKTNSPYIDQPITFKYSLRTSGSGSTHEGYVTIKIEGKPVSISVTGDTYHNNMFYLYTISEEVITGDTTTTYIGTHELYFKGGSWTSGDFWDIHWGAATNSIVFHENQKTGLQEPTNYIRVLQSTTGRIGGSVRKVVVTQNNTENAYYPLIWSSPENGTTSDSELFKSYNNLTYNPSARSLVTECFTSYNNLGTANFIAESPQNAWAYISFKSGSSNKYHIATKSNSEGGSLWLGRRDGSDTGILIGSSIKLRNNPSGIYYYKSDNSYLGYVGYTDLGLGMTTYNAVSGNTFVLKDAGGIITNTNISATNFVSTVATGTQPYACSSTTLNTNLNADMLDGVHLAGYGGKAGVMRSWARGTYTTVNQYFGNGNVVVIDPKPTDDSTLSPNTIIFSLGDSSIRNTQLAFFYETDRIKYRRAVDGPTWGSWRTIAFTDSNISGTAAYANILKSNNTTSVPTGLLFYTGWIPQGNTNNRSWCSPTGNYTSNSVKGEYGSIVRVNYGNIYYNELFFDANSARPSWRKITGTNSTGWKTLGLQEDIRPSGFVTSDVAGLSSYWGKLWEATHVANYNDVDITFYIHSAHNLKRGFVHIRVRRNSVTTDGVTTYVNDVNMVQISGNIPTSDIRLYHDATTGKMELWLDVKTRWGVYNANVISCTNRIGNELIPIAGTLFSNDFTTVLTLPTYSYITLSNLASHQTPVYLNTTNNIEYPLVWSNLTNTSNITADLLYKSYSDLTYNPSNQRITAGEYRGTANGAVLYWGDKSEFHLGKNSTTDFYFWSNSTTARLRLGTNGSERLTILANGNVGISNINPSYKLDVNGHTRIYGNLLIGANTTRNYIAFRGTTGDGDGAFNHTYIGENIYYGTESSELVLFKGNDLASNAANPNGTGPDRIRYIAAGHLFQIYRSPISGTFESVCTSTKPVNTLAINADDVTSYLNVLPSANNTLNLGSSSLKWANIYATTFTGNATSATSATKVYVNQHTGNDNEYPLVWSNLTNTTNALENQLYKSYANLLYNPKYNRITASTFRGELFGSFAKQFSFGGGLNNGKYYYVGSVTLTNAWQGYHSIWSFTGHERAWAGLLYVGFRLSNTTTAFSGVLVEWLSLTDPTLANSIKMTYEDTESSRVVRIYILLQNYISSSTAFIINSSSSISLSGTVVDSYSGTLYTSSVGPISTSVSTDRSITIVPHNNNEINFGGSNTSTTVYIGHRKIDNKPTPTSFIFGNSGAATLTGSGFIKNGSSNNYILLGGGGHKLVSDFAPASSLGNYLPLSGGTMTGPICSDGGYIIMNPIGASYHTSSDAHSGCITINLPAGISNTMVSMWIDVYNYSTQTSFSVHCGGYTYTNSTWQHNPFAIVYGANHRVRLGHNGTNFVIYIGETNSTWSYPQVSVRNITMGYSPSFDNWKKAWSVGFSTSVSNVTYDTTTYAWTTKNFTPSNYYTKTESDSRYVNVAGDTLTGALNFANGIWNKVGDDSAMGDCNKAGLLGIKSLNNNLPGIAFFNSSGTQIGSFYSEASVPKWNANTMWHAGNDGSGSGLDADKLDGKHLSDLNVDLVYTIDCNSLSDSNFYPIVFSSSTDPLHCRIRSSSRSGGHAWNQNTMEFIYCGSGWSDTPHALTITNYGCYSTSEITIGCIGRGNEGGVVCIWVRGGSAYYLSSNRVGSLKTSNYTSGNEIYTVGTNYYGGANTKVTILFTPLSTISSGNYASGNFKAGNNCYAAHFYENSDIKLKTNIETITSSSNIPQLKSFDWKSDGSHSYGLIALELEEMGYSELVDTSGEHKTVNYSAALSLIVGKLQVKIRELEKEIENLKNKN